MRQTSVDLHDIPISGDMESRIKRAEMVIREDSSLNPPKNTRYTELERARNEY